MRRDIFCHFSFDVRGLKIGGFYIGRSEGPAELADCIVPFTWKSKALNCDPELCYVVLDMGKLSLFIHSLLNS